MAGTGGSRNVLVAFNTVERLLKGDFFHCVTSREVAASLAPYAPEWRVMGIGTSNRESRHGELFIDGTVAAPLFTWADPEGDPPAAVVDIGPNDPLPFAAAAVCDPGVAPLTWTLDPGEDVHAGVDKRCSAANIGLAALRLRGELRDVAYQVMCHIPVGGVAADRPAVARHEHDDQGEWDALGIYAANPTIQSVVSHGVAAVHFHARAGLPRRGGHLNAASAGDDTVVEAWPVGELVIRIVDLDVAVHPDRAR